MGPRSLYELERMVFVPAAPRAALKGFSGPAADYSIPRPLLVDQYELTRADWRHYGGADPSPSEWRLEAAWREEARDDWPAFLSQREAVALGAERGMRLLTAREWIHVAVGPRGHPLPWGPTDQKSTANTLELGLLRPLPVGTFENGRSEPFGCYDLLGNVWEWVADRVPGYADPQGDTLGLYRVSAMGGSCLSRKRETYGPAPLVVGGGPVFHAVTLDPRHRAPDVGVRFCADARRYLEGRAREWGSAPDARRRLEAVGAGWGREALGLLRELAAPDGAPPALRWLQAGAERGR